VLLQFTIEEPFPILHYCNNRYSMAEEKASQCTANFCSINASRRDFLKQSSLLTGLALTPATVLKAAEEKWDEDIASSLEKMPLKMEVNGVKHTLTVEPRVTLLDLLREQLALTGTKKGCDYGQCGACTVHVNGVRVLSCLSLAVMQEGKKVTTIEGLAKGEQLHPMQQAFIKHDGFQCGYCTPAKLCRQWPAYAKGMPIQKQKSGNL
jgi:xanthine dehydrogenase YagT iron-sulfur-binding subunit